MINPVAQGYGIQTIPQTTKSAPQDGETRSGAGGDKVTISEEARAMSAAASDRSAGGLGLLQTEMPLLKAEELENLTEEVSGRITALLLENDIPTSPPAELYVDSAGAVRVKGNHPNKERIEQALAEGQGIVQRLPAGLGPDLHPGGRETAHGVCPRLCDRPRSGRGPIRLSFRRHPGRPVHHDHRRRGLGPKRLEIEVV